MKYINYIIMAVASLALACSCSDDTPTEIVNLGINKAEVVNLTPKSFGIKVDLENWDIYNFISVNIKEEGWPIYSQYVDSINPITIFDLYVNDILPGKTYHYQVVGSLKNSGTNYVECELATGTVTTPTIEEYINKYFGICVMEQSVLTHNSAIITAKLPDGVRINGEIKAVYSTSPDFTGAIEVKASNQTDQHASFYLTDLQTNTKYYVKVHGDFKIGDQYFNDCDLQLSPDNFTTLSEGQISSDAHCSFTTVYTLDTEACIAIPLPIGWSMYKKYSSDPINCTLIYGTDPTFAKNTLELDYNSSIQAVLIDLLPETTYYVALKGDFKCEGMVMKNHIIPADKSFTTSHQNQVEMVDGHACVDLGLSVKWATNNLKVGAQEYFEWPYTDLEDIAGTEFDVVTKSWGAPWQMPSEAQFKELIDNCTVLFSDTYLIFVANNGNYIRLEKKGYFYNYSYGGYAYWTSTISHKTANSAKAFGGDYLDYLPDYKSGYCSFSYIISSFPISYKLPIRPVTTK